MFSSNSVGGFDYSASGIASLRSELADTKERYNDALNDLRNERAAAKAERMELKRLQAKNSLAEMSYPLPQDLKVRQEIEEEAKHSADMEKCADEISMMKEVMTKLRHENQDLRGQVNRLKGGSHAKFIEDLEEVICKWEALYFESAEVGNAQMAYLEEEVEELRNASWTNHEAAQSAQSHIEALSLRLKTSSSDSQKYAQELKQYKEKSKNRILALKKRLEGTKIEYEEELYQTKQQLEGEIPLMDQLERLERELNVNTRKLEKERLRSAKREMELEKQLLALRKLSGIESQETDEVMMQDIFTVFVRKMGEKLCSCTEDTQIDSQPVTYTRFPPAPRIRLE